MARSGFHIARVFGISIDADYSWLLIFFLIVWQLGTGLGGPATASWPPALRMVLAVVAALLFFGSVVLHELAHSLVAKALGVPVRRITLFLFGGVSNIEREPPSAGAEFLIAVVGPLTSIVLGVVCMLLAAAVAGTSPSLANPAGIAASLGPASTVLFWLGSINLILGVFNLVPGFPLDGGRVLRSILWGLTGNLRRATRWAAAVGQGVAWLMVVAGFCMMFGTRVPFFGTGVVGGLWLVFIGWFLNGAARASYGQLVVQDVLQAAPVSQIMRTQFAVVPPDMTVSRVVYDYLMGSDDRAFPVVDTANSNRLLGLVCMHDVRRVRREAWDTTLVTQVMTPVERLQALRPEDDAAEALRLMSRYNVGQVPVVDTGSLVGLVQRADIVRWLQDHADEAERRMAA